MKFKGFTLIEAVISLVIILLTLQLTFQLVNLNQRVTNYGTIEKINKSYFYLRISDLLNQYEQVEIDRSKSQNKQVHFIAKKENQISYLSLVLKESVVVLQINDQGYIPVLTEVYNGDFCYNNEKGFSLNVEDSKKRKSQLLFTLKN